MKLACQLNDILPGTGVCALLEGRQIALFRPSAAAEVFAIDNRDPFFAANVLSRGIIGEHEGELWIARRRARASSPPSRKWSVTTAPTSSPSSR